MVLQPHPTIHEPNTSNCSIGSVAPIAPAVAVGEAGNGNSPIFFPRLKTQTPCADSLASDPLPQAASTLSFQAHIAVIAAGV